MRVIEHPTEVGPDELGRDAPSQPAGQDRAAGLFGDLAPEIGSVALVRLALWDPARTGLIAFGAADPEAFAPDMGMELIGFLAEVVERTAARWPVL